MIPCAAASASIAASVPASTEMLAFACRPLSRTTGIIISAARAASARRDDSGRPKRYNTTTALAQIAS